MASENCLQQIIPGVADKGVLVEIGVLRASNLLALSDMFPEMQFIGVDSYEAYTDPAYTVTSKISQLNREIAENRIANSGHSHRIKLIVEKSKDVAHKTLDNSINLVYLDKGFTEQEQFDDVVQWFPKVKTGGILAGHEAYTPEILNATRQALDSMSVNYNINIVDNEVWYIRKN